MADITMEKVCKRYGSVSVIEDLNLDIHEHEFMVLVGPSGCGKSTLLRMIAGLEEISDGTMKIADRVVNDVHPKDRDVAMVFQSYALYPHMTVRENMAFGLKVRKTPAGEIEKLVNEAAKILGLSHLLERKPKALSGGQRQRVALGRAIVRKPSVFLFDEPLSNLDAELRVQMRAEISKLQKRLGITSVYVTHDQVEAMTMGHRITVLHAGKIQQVGTPLELFETPDNLFVARFIGTPPMNTIDGSINQAGDAVQIGNLKLPVTGETAKVAKAHRGKEIVIGIRPEHIGNGDWPEELGLADIDAEVEVVEPLGHEVVVYFEAQGTRMVGKLDAHTVPQIGDNIQLKVRCDLLHLFDKQTELRLTAD